MAQNGAGLIFIDVIGRLSWVIQVSPNAVTCVLIRWRQREIPHTEKMMWRWSRERFEDVGLEDWSDVAVKQRMLGSHQKLENPRGAFSPDSKGSQGLADILILFCLQTSGLHSYERMLFFLLLQSSVCGNLLQQPWETNTGANSLEFISKRNGYEWLHLREDAWSGEKRKEDRSFCYLTPSRNVLFWIREYFRNWIQNLVIAPFLLIKMFLVEYFNFLCLLYKILNHVGNS